MPWHPDTLAALEESGVRLSPAQLERLDRYAVLISERGRSLGLVSPGDYQRLHDRHLFDSLTVVPLVEWSGKRVFDLGSGAGLPGIPLAIAQVDTRFVLVERTRKRAAFISHAIGALGLGNAQVLWCDAASLARQSQYAQAADVVTIRALAQTSTALALARALVKPGGVILLWQTRDQTEREPTPDGFDATWHPAPSRDAVERGIRVCRLHEGG